MSGDSLDSTEFVFRSLYKRKNGTHALRSGSRLSYSRARELFILKFKAIGLDTKLYGLHSFRIAALLLLLIMIYQIALLKSMVGGSLNTLRMFIVGRIFNTNF